MNFSSKLFFAKKFVLGGHINKKDSWKKIRSGIIGLALSLVPLIVVVELAQGMIEGIISRYIELKSFHMRVLPSLNESNPSENIDSLKNAIVQSGLVQGAFKEINGNGLLKGKKSSGIIQIRGLENNVYDKDPGFNKYLNIVSGQFDLSNKKNIVIGDAIAEKLEIQVGDSIRLMTFMDQEFNGLPRISSFIVKGIVSSGYQDMDKYWVFMDFDKAAEIININQASISLGVTIDNPFEINSTISQGSKSIHIKDHEYSYDNYFSLLNNVISNNQDISAWYLETWAELENRNIQNYSWAKNILTFIMILIVIIAGFNVMSVMVLLVVDKEEEIALLRSSGAKPNDISTIFSLMALIIGSLGLIFGLVIGGISSLLINEIIYIIEAVTNFFSWLIFSISNGFDSSQFQVIELLNHKFYLSRIPVNLHLDNFIFIGIMTIIISVVSSIIPAFKASKIKPVEIFRRL